MPFKDQRIASCIMGGLALLSGCWNLRYILPVTASPLFVVETGALLASGTGLILYRRWGFLCLYGAFLLALLQHHYYPCISIPFWHALGLKTSWLQVLNFLVISVAVLLHTIEERTSRFAVRPSVTFGEVLLPVGIGLISVPILLLLAVVCERATVMLFRGESLDMGREFFVWGPLFGGGRTFGVLLGIIGIIFHIVHPLAALACAVGFLVSFGQTIRIVLRGAAGNDLKMMHGVSPIGLTIVLAYGAVALTVSHPLMLGLLLR